MILQTNVRAFHAPEDEGCRWRQPVRVLLQLDTVVVAGTRPHWRPHVIPVKTHLIQECSSDKEDGGGILGERRQTGMRVVQLGGRGRGLGRSCNGARGTMAHASALQGRYDSKGGGAAGQVRIERCATCKAVNQEWYGTINPPVSARKQQWTEQRWQEA